MKAKLIKLQNKSLYSKPYNAFIQYFIQHYNIKFTFFLFVIICAIECRVAPAIIGIQSAYSAEQIAWMPKSPQQTVNQNKKVEYEAEDDSPVLTKLKTQYVAIREKQQKTVSPFIRVGYSGFFEIDKASMFFTTNHQYMPLIRGTNPSNPYELVTSALNLGLGINFYNNAVNVFFSLSTIGSIMFGGRTTPTAYAAFFDIMQFSNDGNIEGTTMSVVDWNILRLSLGMCFNGNGTRAALYAYLGPSLLVANGYFIQSDTSNFFTGGMEFGLGGKWHSSVFPIGLGIEFGVAVMMHVKHAASNHILPKPVFFLGLVPRFSVFIEIGF